MSLYIKKNFFDLPNYLKLFGQRQGSDFSLSRFILLKKDPRKISRTVRVQYC